MTDDESSQEVPLKNGKLSSVENGDSLINFRDSPVIFNQPKSRQYFNKTFLIIFCIIFLLTLIALILTVSLLMKKNHNEANGNLICSSQQCINISARVVSFMDSTADPCKDFYQYSCGKWIENNAIDTDIFRVLGKKRVQFLYSYFDENVKKIESTKNKAVKKLLMFYKSCMIEPVTVDPFKTFVNKKIGGSPLTNHSWSGDDWSYFEKLVTIESLVLRYRYDQGKKLSPFLDSYVKADPYKPELHVFTIGYPKLTVPADHFTSENIKQFRKTYMKTLIKAAQQFGLKEEEAEKYMKEVFDLEKKIAEILPSAAYQKNEKKNLNKIKIKELYEITDNEFDWLKYINNHLNGIGLNLTKEDRVNVKSIDYVRDVVKIMKSASKRSIANYFTWLLIVNYEKALPKSIRTLFVRINEMNFRREFNKCIGIVSEFMGFALAFVTVEETFDMKTKGEVSAMLEYIKSTFDEKIESNGWMDKSTKEKARIKVNAMAGNIAYPKFILNPEKLAELYNRADISTDDFINNIANLANNNNQKNLLKLNQKVNRELWDHPPIDENAMYDKSRNKMVFFSEILKAPFYSWKGPKSINFGAIGMVMGHELIHGFDNQGRLFDEKGGLNNWWSNSSSEKFNKRSQCFVQQYSSYSKYGTNIDGNQTLGENIADNEGIDIAFRAYHNWIREEGPDIKLPGLNLTNDQLFFVGTSQQWCMSISEKSFKDMVQYEIHAPSEFRVKGMMSNSKAFAKTFNCKKDSVMNPSNKCVLY